MKRADFVNAALDLLGTPFLHQGRLPGIALDCAGVVVCAARAAGYKVADVQGYARIPSHGQFMGAVMEHCDTIAIEDAQPGDLMMFAFRSEPQHIAIITRIDPITILHSYQQVGKVVMNRLDDTWRSRLRGSYRLRGLE